MCGHDGHMTCLVGALAKVLEKRQIIPSNCTLRAIFQPGEEGHAGASLMIKEGVLQGVDEIYGLHNVPWANVGDVFVMPGHMMAAVDKLTIRVNGKGGHSSEIHKLVDPVYSASLINVKVNALLRGKYSAQYPSKMRLSFPQINTASACNVIPGQASMVGTLRVFDQELRKSIRNDIIGIMAEVDQSTGCTSSMEVLSLAMNPVDNDPKLTEAFMGVLKGQVRTDKLPIFASEDFADYQEVVPGVFFFVGGGTENGDSLHVDHYNFNDDIIDRASDIFFQIVENRFKDK